MAVGGKDTTWKHGTNGAVAVNTDFTTATMEVNPSFNAEEADATTFGDSYRNYEQTFKNGTVAVKYYFSTTVWNQIAAIYNGGDTVTFELGPTGTTGGGINAKITGEMCLLSLSPPFAVGNVITFDTSWRISGAVTFTTFS
jgi:hypothetical protein